MSEGSSSSKVTSPVDLDSSSSGSGSDLEASPKAKKKDSAISRKKILAANGICPPEGDGREGNKATSSSSSSEDEVSNGESRVDFVGCGDDDINNGGGESRIDFVGCEDEDNATTTTSTSLDYVKKYGEVPRLLKQMKNGRGKK